MELSEAEVVRLAGLRGSGPIVSCYLDVCGRNRIRPIDYERDLEHLIRRERPRAVEAGVVDDLDEILGFVRSGVDRSRTRGLAMFSAKADDLWEVVHLPVSVRTQLLMNPAPAVRQLESIIQEHEPIAVLLVDKQRTRLFEFSLGVLVEQTEHKDELPRDYDDRGERERGTIDPHVDELLHQHVRHAAEAAFEMHKRSPCDHLVVGGSTAVIPMLESELHPYLVERLRGQVDLPTTAGLDEIRTAVLNLEARIERDREDVRVAALREAVAADRGGVAGLPAVLGALHEQRIDRLLVSDGYTEGGWLCEACGRLAAVGRTCPSCRAEMIEIDDVVEEAVEEAITRSCSVEVCVDNADLDVLGRIGAVLHY